MKITKKNIKALGYSWPTTRVRVTPNTAMRQWYVDLRVIDESNSQIIYIAQSEESAHKIAKKLARWIGEFAEGAE